MTRHTPRTVSTGITALLIALAAVPMLSARRAPAQPEQPAAPQRVLLQESDRVGELRTVNAESRLELTFSDAMGGQRKVVDQTVRQLDTLTLEIDEQQRAIRLQVVVRKLRRVQSDGGRETVNADPMEGRKTVLLDRGAVDGLRGPSEFPLPSHAVAVGESWRVTGDEALRSFSGDGIYDTAEATLTLESLSTSPNGHLIAQIRRRLTRSGTGDGSTIREQGEGALVFDLTAGRPLEMRSQSTVEVAARGGVSGSGPRVASATYSYRQQPLYRIAPRAQAGVTQTERAESVRDLVIGAVSKRQPDRQAVLHRHIETLSVMRRTPATLDDAGRPLQLTLDVPASWRMETVDKGIPGQKPEQTVLLGPLHELSGLELARETASQPLALDTASTDTLRRQLAARLAAASGGNGGSEPDPRTVAAEIQRVTAFLSAALQRMMVPGLPQSDVPCGYTWQLPESVAIDAFADMLDGVRVTGAQATATFVDVRQWGGRPRVATLLTRLQLAGEGADGLRVEADLPSITFFDLDESRPLAMRGDGRMAMAREDAELKVRGEASIRADTRYSYSTGPNVAADPDDDARLRFAGTWLLQPQAGPDARYRLKLQADGSVSYSHPDLAGGSVVETGHWRVLDPLPNDGARKLRLVIVLGDRNRDVWSVAVAPGGKRLTLTRIEDTPRRTGIFPALLDQSADWVRQD